MMLRRPWHIANTTVRSPHRLRAGLEALIAGGFEGDMGKAQEEHMARALDEAGVIRLSPDTRDVTSIARKWRSALIKLGFLWPEVNKVSARLAESSVSLGDPYTMTSNGKRLLLAKSLPAANEVFLRSLAAFNLPSVLEPGYTFPTFSPLRHVIHILEHMEVLGMEAYISRLEMASIVILTDASVPIGSIVEEVREQRESRKRSSSKRSFDSGAIEAVQGVRAAVKASTLFDYQDLNFRYLKATGLFQSRGRGIAFVSERRRVASLIAAEVSHELSGGEYITRLAAGAGLPTDNAEGAAAVLDDLIAVAAEWEVDVDLSEHDLKSVEGVSIARHELEERIFLAKEAQFASSQREQLDEILCYLQVLEGKKGVTLRGEPISIPVDERPAYFEWLLWRVILALNELRIPSHEVRRFNIDQDFLPVATAPGGGADLIAVYDDYVLVVEVTLTESSRQEAAEGEPVRRHVAQALEQYAQTGKRVYGLFVARKVDTNTAETFRIGVWYLKGDVRVDLDIAPLTISQLRAVLQFAHSSWPRGPEVLVDLIESVTEKRRQCRGAPEWKAAIENLIEV